MTESTEPLKTVKARVVADKVAALDELAGHQSRGRSFLITAIDQYLAHRHWMLVEIKNAVAEADEGHFLSENENEAFMKELAGLGPGG
jgi:predicted transcriptional regulator